VKFRTQVVKGTITGAQGREQAYEVTFKAPDRFLLVTEGQQGKVTQALTGDTGWVVGPRGGQRFNAAELAGAKRSAETLALVKFAPSPTMRVAGRRRVGEREAVVVVDRPSETVQRRYFFDAETGLLLRITTLTDALLNQIPEQVDFEDYREVEGVKVPFTVRVSSVVPFNNQTRTVTEVRPGLLIDDKLFEMPGPSGPAKP
jgi:outer membrane lipoprotein-sorting protein